MPRPTPLLLLLLLAAATVTAAPAKKPAPPPPPPESVPQLRGITALHNQRRCLYGDPPLAWDATLAAQAQAYTNNCVFACAFAFDPAPDHHFASTRISFDYQPL